jgi:hypothetical protein
MVVMALSAYSQGNIQFANLVISGTTRPVDAPVFLADGTTRASGAAFQAQLYARAAGSANAYAAVGAAANFLTGTGAGYFIPGSRSAAGLAAGTSAQTVVRAWQVSSGSTWETATVRGESTPINITLTAPPDLPAPMLGLQSFQIVPEPSTIALGILGGLWTLVLMRRRK